MAELVADFADALRLAAAEPDAPADLDVPTRQGGRLVVDRPAAS